MGDRVYLDWNATVPLRAEARAAMVAAMDIVGNPSSVHGEGRAAKALIEGARETIAAAAGAQASDIIFTSGATEAAALLGHYYSDGITASDIEHDCVHVLASTIAGDVQYDGRVDLPMGQISRGTAARHGIALQAANSETGVLQAWEQASKDMQGYQADCFCDAVQAFGKVPFGFDWTGFSAALLSAHKIGGPKGAGALIIRRGLDVQPLIRGGGQEMGCRSGTENIIGIAGFAAAARAAQLEIERGVWRQVGERRDAFEAAMLDAVSEAVIVGGAAARLPNTSCIMVPGWKGETQVMQMDLGGFAVSAGSACSSGKVKTSRVLRAMGFDESAAGSAIRISIGPTTRDDDLNNFVAAWAGAYGRHRARAA